MNCKLSILTFLTLFATALTEYAWADAKLLTIRGLYERSSYTVNTTLPFVIDSRNGQEVKILRVEMANIKGACGMRIDPFRANVFLVRCSSAGQVDFRILLELGSSTFETFFGPISIDNFQDNLGSTGSGSPVDDPEIFKGQQLFGSYCVRCHLVERPHASTTVADIKSAIRTVPSMRQDAQLRTLTEANLELVRKFLGSRK